MDGISSYTFLTLQPMLASYKGSRNFPAAVVKIAKACPFKIGYWLASGVAPSWANDTGGCSET